MSKTMRWVLVLVCVAVLVGALWMSGLVPGFSAKTQSAAVSNSVSTVAASSNDGGDPALLQDAAAIDAQLRVSAAAVSGLEKTPSVSGITAAAAQVQAATGLMAKFSGKFQVRIGSVTTGQAALQAALKDLNRTILNAGSQATVASKNVTAKTPDAAALQQAGVQLQAAQGYLQTGRGDIQTLLQGIAKR